MNDTNVKNFLIELSFLITDLETKKAGKRAKIQMHKVILRFFENLTPREQKKYRKYINGLKQRVLKVETIEHSLLDKIKKLKDDSVLYEAIIEILKSEK